jgi:cytochrome c5
MRRIVYWLAMVVALSACDRTPPPEKTAVVPDYVRAHDIHHLMEVVVDPQADVFWNSSGTINDASGQHDLTPTTDEGWFATQSAAATVAEMGNLLMTPQFAEGRGTDWNQFARSLVEIGMLAEKAAADRNPGAVLEVGDTMDKVCEACHQVYLPGAAQAQAQRAEGGKEQ